MTMINKCKICGGVDCQCKNKNTREEEQARAEQNTYEDNSNVGGLVIDDTGECESCQQLKERKDQKERKTPKGVERKKKVEPWSGWLDLNQRSPGPKPDAIPDFATARAAEKQRLNRDQMICQCDISLIK